MKTSSDLEGLLPYSLLRNYSIMYQEDKNVFSDGSTGDANTIPSSVTSLSPELRPSKPVSASFVVSELEDLFSENSWAKIWRVAVSYIEQCVGSRMPIKKSGADTVIARSNNISRICPSSRRGSWKVSIKTFDLLDLWILPC